MATFNIARDGHRYLTRGYPIINERGQEDTRFCTYQLEPRAERLFDEAHFEEGESVPRETFYALLVEGSIYNNARPTGIPITAVPKSILRQAREEEHRLRPRSPRDQASIDRAQYLIDVFNALRHGFGNTAEALSVASWFCLRQHSGEVPRTRSPRLFLRRMGTRSVREV
jgi:hypothetical protein